MFVMFWQLLGWMCARSYRIFIVETRRLPRLFVGPVGFYAVPQISISATALALNKKLNRTSFSLSLSLSLYIYKYQFLFFFFFKTKKKKTLQNKCYVWKYSHIASFGRTLNSHWNEYYCRGQNQLVARKSIRLNVFTKREVTLSTDASTDRQQIESSLIRFLLWFSSSIDDVEDGNPSSASAAADDFTTFIASSMLHNGQFFGWGYFQCHQRLFHAKLLKGKKTT